MKNMPRPQPISEGQSAQGQHPGAHAHGLKGQPDISMDTGGGGIAGDQSMLCHIQAESTARVKGTSASEGPYGRAPKRDAEAQPNILIRPALHTHLSTGRIRLGTHTVQSLHVISRDKATSNSEGARHGGHAAAPTFSEGQSA